MILVLGGTTEGRVIAAAITSEGFQVIITVVSGYGRELIDRESSAEVLVGRLNTEDLQQLISEKKIRLVIDATHPYAKEITGNAWEAVRKTGTPYIRYERPGVQGVHPVYAADSYEEAARLALNLGDILFLAIGSRNLEPFVREARRAGKRIIARVLPEARVLSECAAMGLSPGSIVAVQGPFSREMNMVMLKEYRADVLVTKDSGSTGGTDTKLEAAAALNIPVVMVTRPGMRGLPITDKIDEILEKAREVNLLSSQGNNY